MSGLTTVFGRLHRGAVAPEISEEKVVEKTSQTEVDSRVKKVKEQVQAKGGFNVASDVLVPGTGCLALAAIVVLSVLTLGTAGIGLAVVAGLALIVLAVHIAYRAYQERQQSLPEKEVTSNAVMQPAAKQEQKKLTVQCALQTGERLEIRGNCTELNDWKKGKALPVVEGQENAYALPLSATLKDKEYKIVLVTAGGKDHWLKGANRRIGDGDIALTLQRSDFE